MLVSLELEVTPENDSVQGHFLLWGFNLSLMHYVPRSQDLLDFLSDFGFTPVVEYLVVWTQGIFLPIPTDGGFICSLTLVPTAVVPH